MVTNTDSAFPDERLELLFICAQPAIDPDVRTPRTAAAGTTSLVPIPAVTAWLPKRLIWVDCWYA